MKFSEIKVGMACFFLERDGTLSPGTIERINVALRSGSPSCGVEAVVVTFRYDVGGGVITVAGKLISREYAEVYNTEAQKGDRFSVMVGGDLATGTVGVVWGTDNEPWVQRLADVTFDNGATSTIAVKDLLKVSRLIDSAAKMRAVARSIKTPSHDLNHQIIRDLTIRTDLVLQALAKKGISADGIISEYSSPLERRIEVTYPDYSLRFSIRVGDYEGCKVTRNDESEKRIIRASDAAGFVSMSVNTKISFAQLRRQLEDFEAEREDSGGPAYDLYTIHRVSSFLTALEKVWMTPFSVRASNEISRCIVVFIHEGPTMSEYTVAFAGDGGIHVSRNGNVCSFKTVSEAAQYVSGSATVVDTDAD